MPGAVALDAFGSTSLMRRWRPDSAGVTARVFGLLDIIDVELVADSRRPMGGVSGSGLSRLPPAQVSLQSASIAAKGRTWSATACKGLFVTSHQEAKRAANAHLRPEGSSLVARHVTRNRRYGVRVRFGRWFLGCATPSWRAV